jgi:hypothetical protein
VVGAGYARPKGSDFTSVGNSPWRGHQQVSGTQDQGAEMGTHLGKVVLEGAGPSLWGPPSLGCVLCPLCQCPLLSLTGLQVQTEKLRPGQVRRLARKWQSWETDQALSEVNGLCSPCTLPFNVLGYFRISPSSTHFRVYFLSQLSRF